MLGILSEYIGRIFDSVRGHPIAIIEKMIEAGIETTVVPDALERPTNR